MDLQAINRQWDEIRQNVGRMRPWFELCRIPYSLTVAVDPLAGALVAGAGWADMPFAVALMFGAFFLHAGAVALNDWHDFKADRVERPDRPIAAGRIGRWYGLFGATVLLGVGWTFASVPGPRSGQLGLAALAAVLLYEFIMKGAPAGKAIPALTRALLFLMGAMIVPVGDAPGGWPLCVFCMTVLTFYTLGAIILAERPEDQYRRVFAISGGAVVGVALAAASMMRIFFPTAAVYPSAALWVGLLLVLTGFPLVRAIARPTDHLLGAAAWSALLGSILLDATLVAFVRNVAVSLAVAAMVLPAIYARRAMCADATAPRAASPSTGVDPAGR